jgi:hypothetical protein
MSRELWAVQSTDDEELHGVYRYAVKPSDITKHAEHIKVTRYVPADSLQPEWWCNYEALTHAYIFQARLGDEEARHAVVYERFAADAVDFGYDSAVRRHVRFLAQNLAEKLWCGGL